MTLAPNTGSTLIPGSTTSTAPWRRSVGVLAVTTISIGVANYAMSLAIVRLLPAAQFSAFAAGQGLLLVLGTGSMAALPWAVARYLARTGGADVAGRAMFFGLIGSLAQAAVFAPIAVVVGWLLDGPVFGLSAGLATVTISLLAGPIGFLQGQHRLPTIAALRAIETAVRIGASLALVLLASRHATVALLGFPIGSSVALAYALRRARSGFPLHRMPRGLALDLSRQALLLGAVQVLLAMLGALDTVYVDGASFSAPQIASYQAASLLARIPLFFSVAISTASYTALAVAPDDSAIRRELRSSLRMYCWLAAPFLLVALSVPRSILDLVVPAAYSQTQPILQILCVAGVVVGAINVLTTAHQAQTRFRRCFVILIGGVLGQALILLALGRFGSVITFTTGETLVGTVTLVVLLADAREWLARPAGPNWSDSPRPRLLALALTAAVVAVIFHNPLPWAAAVLTVSLIAVRNAFDRST